MPSQSLFLVSFLLQPINVRGEVTLNKNNFLYAGKTELEYSSDPTEKLTLSGRVNDLSYGRGQNYSVNMKVSHPKSLINVDVTSHVGNTDNKMSAGMEMNYMTARRSEENFLLRGEIDKLRKSINVQVIVIKHICSFQLVLLASVYQLQSGIVFTYYIIYMKCHDSISTTKLGRFVALNKLSLRNYFQFLLP